MAYRIEKNDLVIDGWQNGIADDPYEGLADIRNANILSIPKEVGVGFANAAITMPPAYNAVAFTAQQGASVQVTNLIVAGGGGGGGGATLGGTSGSSGGGGAGGAISSTSLVTSQAYSVVVGAGGAAGLGGAGANNATPGADGTNSSFNTQVAIGGGGGGANNNLSGNGQDGRAGGSGGGAGAITNGSASGAAGAGSQGSSGGLAFTGSPGLGGGGGGFGGVGGTGSASTGGTGGTGLTSSISGSSVAYAGGGGGGTNGAGTDGGGNAGAAGTANRGGGGGGATGANTAGGAGGTGIVIISCAIGNITSATGGTHTTSGGNDIWTLTSSGMWTPTVAVSANPDTITVATTDGFYNGMAVVINSTSGTTGLSSSSGNNTYYVGNITATTFKLYRDLKLTNLVAIIGNGSGTLSTAQFSKPFDSTQYAQGIYNDDFILDDTGQAWLIGNGRDGYALNTLQFLGNTNHSAIISAGSLGICAWKGYLFVLIGVAIDYVNISTLEGSSGPNGAWISGWQSITNSDIGHKAISATDDAMYFCNHSAVGLLLQNAGTTFDPNDSGTYTYNQVALALPSFDIAHCLVQLGIMLLVGGIKNYIYPWDRISPSFAYPLIVAESYIAAIVSTNSTAYILAGNRGMIYETNGANTQEFKKFPDQLTNTETPLFTWGDACYWKNTLYFGISATTNAGVAINNFAGVWAIDLTKGSLYLANALSYGTYTGTVPVIVPMGNPNAFGTALYVGWINGSNVGGIDYGTSDPYVNYESYIDSDMIPVGLFHSKYNFGNAEYKVSKPLVTGESIRISYRKNLTDAFTILATFTTINGEVSDSAETVNFQDAQWIQLRISMSSTLTTPSYDRLREVRLR